MLSLAVLSGVACFSVVLAFLTRRLLIHMPVYLAVSSGLLALAAATMVIIQFDSLAVAKERLDWPSTDGIVIESKVVGERAFRPNIIYGYQVDSASYADTTSLNPPSFGGRSSKRSTASRLVADYPKGRAITVFYDPSNPAKSTLRPHPSWSEYGKIGFWSVLFGLGLYGLAGFVLRRRGEP